MGEQFHGFCQRAQPDTQSVFNDTRFPKNVSCQVENSSLALVQRPHVTVFSAGAGGRGGPEMTNAIDGRGLELAVDAAKEAGIRRFLLVSAFPDAARDEPRRDGFENYMRVKRLADVYLAESGLDWVILRPGLLSDAPGSGKVRLGPAIPYGVVPRDDVAATLVEIIENPRIGREIIELTEGSISVEEAVERLAR